MKNAVSWSSGANSIRTEDEGKSSVLVFEAATRENAALYTCYAANRYGTDTKSFRVNVVGKKKLEYFYEIKIVLSFLFNSRLF